MTEEEAKLFLSVEDNDEIVDVYEEKLFELKQFFLNRFPVTKLIRSKLASFEKVETAYRVLGGDVEITHRQGEQFFPNAFDSLKEVFTWYYQQKNTVRLQIMAAQSHDDLAQVMKQYVQVAQYYAKQWEVSLQEEDKVGIAIGSEPDPMDIQTELNRHETEGKDFETFILSLPNENCLKSEAKRLSLWLKFESNE